jgi:hypothetical protein
VFPYFVVIIKPISTTGKNGLIRLGNLYLHFALTDSKDDMFYHRFLNDFVHLWLREEGNVVIDKITDEKSKQQKLELAKDLNLHLPDIWASKNSEVFDNTEINKINKPFGTSGKTLKDFYDEVFFFNYKKCQSLLEELEKKIIEDLIPILLFNNKLISNYAKLKRSDEFIKIKMNVEHQEFTGFEIKDVKRFITLLALRHIVNVCFCCFGLSIDEVHNFLTTGSIIPEANKEGKFSYSNRLTVYFSKLFFYVRKNNGKREKIIDFKKENVYSSASGKEKLFLKDCVSEIQRIISVDKIDDYNKIAIANCQITVHNGKKYNPESVSFLAVYTFKTTACNENEIIPVLLKERAGKYLVGPIIDCGAGLGDIAYHAFPEKEAILVDVNSIEHKEILRSPLHEIVNKSIFDYYPTKDIKTLLISHTLQFIDSDIERLNNLVHRLHPDNIILILNENNDIMGEILKWTKDHYDNPNPEEKVIGFPLGYDCVERINFSSTVKCTSFLFLAKQISYLMMIDLSETGDQLEKFLQTKLEFPEFNFNQVIEIYQRRRMA